MRGPVSRNCQSASDLGAIGVSWKGDLETLIRDRWRPGQRFTLGQLYEFEDALGTDHPRNSHIRARIRQTLQSLRDDGVISFVDGDGTYLRLN